MNQIIFASIVRQCDHQNASDFVALIDEDKQTQIAAKDQLLAFLKTNRESVIKPLSCYQDDDDCDGNTEQQTNRADTIDAVIGVIEASQDLPHHLCEYLDDGYFDEDGEIISQIIIKRLPLAKS